MKVIGPLVALQLGDHLVGADVLGDAAGLALADVGVADRVQQARLAVVDVTHDRDDRRPEHEVVLVAGVLAVGDGEAVEQLAVLLLRADDLHLVVHLGAEQLEDLVGDRLRRGDHLAEVEQHLHQRGRVGVDLVGEVGQRRTAGELDDLAAALRQADAADRGGLHRVELLALLPLRLATLAGRSAGTAERTRGTAATTTAATTGTTTAATTGTETATGRGTAATGTAATGTETATGTAAATGTETAAAGTTAPPPGPPGRPPGPPGRPPPGPPGRPPPDLRAGGHHAGVRPRGHVARRRPRATAAGVTRTRGRRARTTGTGTALARERRPGRGRLTALAGAVGPGAAGRAGDAGRARRGAGTDAEGVVADTRGARAGTRRGGPRRHDRRIRRPRRCRRNARAGRRTGTAGPVRGPEGWAGAAGAAGLRLGAAGQQARRARRSGLLARGRAGTRPRPDTAGSRRVDAAGGSGRARRRRGGGRRRGGPVQPTRPRRRVPQQDAGRTGRAGRPAPTAAPAGGVARGGPGTAPPGRGAPGRGGAGGRARHRSTGRARTRRRDGGRAPPLESPPATDSRSRARDGCLDRGGGGLHVLTEILQLAEDLLAADAELLGELVHAGLACHCSPIYSEAGGGSRSTSNLVSKHVHGAIFTTGS